MTASAGTPAALRTGARRFEMDGPMIAWMALIAVFLLSLALRDTLPWLTAYPPELVVPVVEVLNVAMTWFVGAAGRFFKVVGWLLGQPLDAMLFLLAWVPWPITIAACALTANAASGWRLAAFTVAGMLYMVIMGYWTESMNTLSLVAISVPLAVLIGFAFGVLGFFSGRAERVIMPMLDLLQTIPTFAYLIPVLLLFGFGPVVGLIASLMYAFPPMVRNTILGLRRVPPEVLESALMSGATPWQLFWHAQVPSALRQILLGVNQTTMAALSMVIIASIIGWAGDIGWEVLSTMRKAQFGESLLAGLVIALIAMIMDRITSGFAMGGRGGAPARAGRSLLERHRRLAIVLGACAALLVLAQFVPALKSFPREWTIDPARPINDVLDFVVANYRTTIETIKNWSFFFVMLPARIGLEKAVSPFSWGFQPTIWHALGYAALVIALAWAAARYWSWRMVVPVLLFSILIFVGITNTPWPAMILLVTVISWRIGGRGLGVVAFLSFCFLLVSGIWPQAMLSIYLCGIAVLISFAIGSALGIWAAHSDRMSAFIRPINDTLQTMPLFVFLIPVLMLFRIGEFTALLAIIFYAVVPAIRYAEHGLRNLPPEILEAATAMGTTRRQLLWQVKLPLALPEIMLGLNQTIIYGIAMLVITALVGTRGLGQSIYIGLSKGNFGIGMTAGIGMALIAIVADRNTQAWSARRKAALGLS
jgi:glycine betaine/proline transport system permease protein